MARPHLLVLDSDVRDWVFVPLTLFIVLMKLVMQYMHQVRPGTALPPCSPRSANSTLPRCHPAQRFRRRRVC
jgi:hypothetical protein